MSAQEIKDSLLEMQEDTQWLIKRATERINDKLQTLGIVDFCKIDGQTVTIGIATSTFITDEEVLAYLDGYESALDTVMYDKNKTDYD